MVNKQISLYMEDIFEYVEQMSVRKVNEVEIGLYKPGIRYPVSPYGLLDTSDGIEIIDMEKDLVYNKKIKHVLNHNKQVIATGMDIKHKGIKTKPFLNINGASIFLNILDYIQMRHKASGSDIMYNKLLPTSQPLLNIAYRSVKPEIDYSSLDMHEKSLQTIPQGITVTANEAIHNLETYIDFMFGHNSEVVFEQVEIFYHQYLSTFFEYAGEHIIRYDPKYVNVMFTITETPGELRYMEAQNYIGGMI